MKKLLTTIALALGTLTIATTTHAVNFHPSTDGNFTDCTLLKQFHADKQAIPGTYIEANCDFGYINNEVTIISDHKDFTPDTTGLTGKYSIRLKNVALPAKKICFYYQKIAGGHSPNWDVLYVDQEASSHKKSLPNMTDHDLHATNIQTYLPTVLLYNTEFGGWSTGDDERIAIYAAVQE